MIMIFIDLSPNFEMMGACFYLHQTNGSRAEQLNLERLEQ